MNAEIEIETVTVNGKEYRLDSLSNGAKELFALHVEAEQLRDAAARQVAIYTASLNTIAEKFIDEVVTNVSDGDTDDPDGGTVTPIRQ